ncbi:pilus assembly protein PilC [Acinetobacter johnsonii]|uniref:pilus assembly protein PilC n=1 Tax=Acinetobacter johnsonii TaxID=40214 RepID=UPI00196AB0AE|nr:pilus assembly protein PilC [Acinetobacter johnsonii]QSE46187.1 pilus assembly protein PilC [Acinetobacter johnsonii]
MKKLNHKNALSATVSMLMTLTVCSSVSQASDIDIYSNTTSGKTTITMMLDTSGSMGNGLFYYSTFFGFFTGSHSTNSLQEDYGVCVNANSTRYESNSDIRTEVKTVTLSDNTTVNYTRYYCRVRNSSSEYTRLKNEGVCTESGTELRCFDRLTRLKDALIEVFQDAEIKDNNILIGLGQYSSSTSSIETSSNADGSTGRILVAAKPMDNTHSDNLIKAIVNLSPYGGTPTAHAYAEIGAYMLGRTTKGSSENAGSGFDKSNTTDIKQDNKYKSPFGTTLPSPTDTCNGQGIYFLTDGAPNSSNNSSKLMRRALGLSSDFSDSGGLPNGSEDNNQMSYVGAFAKKIRSDYNIKTAVVGFGKDFIVNENTLKLLEDPLTNEIKPYYDCTQLSGDARNACNWGAKQHAQLPSNVGGFGNGGFYSAQSTQDIIDSIKYFVGDTKPTFDPVATGSPTLPQDALNPLRIQPYGYYASFLPKPQESTQLWVGNMNKYHIFNGELYNASKTTRLIKADGSLDSTAEGLWINGMKGQLPLGIGTNAANEQVANRTIYTNREITGTAAPYAASEIGSLKKVNVATLFGTGSTALFVNDPDKNYWLNLLGYNVAETGTVTLADLITKPELRQVGSVMHSTPILLTQSGKISYTSGTIDTTDRDDYLLFGTTQGLLHVVKAGKNSTDADRGKEVFTFVPHEMMRDQKTAFLKEDSTTGGSANLFYGIDAPWTAYTQYVAKADGTLTVKDSGRVAQNASGDDIAIKGLQWVYGGLRMGGKSYYALNLSDLDNPELKFHIDPASSKIYKSSSTTTGVTALSYMGQSWSKPTIAYVKFGGEKKLVMFVGGGYDAGYENAAYDQNTTTGGGAGVYMFDANNGDLLWWTSANATAAGGAEAFTDASEATINMKYSVVSQINAIDRDSDGLVDNLYFGDLGGQGFRVDLNNAATGADASAKKANFVKRVVRLFDEHATGGASPRFYEMPSVSIHDSDDGYVAAVAFSSGNRSSPLVGTAVVNGNQAGSTTSATDGVFVVYDKDVARTDLYNTLPDTGATGLKTKNIALTSLNSNISTGVAVTGNNGWKYIYSNTAGVYKGMNELYAVDGMLYVNVYHRDGTGIGGSCGAGVKGDSYIYQFCLPTGKCSFATTNANTPNSVKLGAGILGAGLGQGFSNANNTGLIVKRPTTLDCATTPNLPECQEFTTTAKLRQLRWYETQ